jgi:Cys-rich repeat protein
MELRLAAVRGGFAPAHEGSTLLDGHHFDELSRALSQSRSRRALAGLLGASLAAALGRQAAGKRRRPKQRRRAGRRVRAQTNEAQGNDACAHFCTATFPAGPARGACTSAAAHGAGPCYQCGPGAGATHPDVCGQACCPAGRPHCVAGACQQCVVDAHCGAGQVCDEGTCCTPPNPADVCTDDTCSCASVAVTCGPPIDCGAYVCAQVGPGLTCFDGIIGELMFCGVIEEGGPGGIGGGEAVAIICPHP